jgi:hypothetical protein
MARDVTEPVTPLPVLEMITKVPTIKAHNISLERFPPA